MRRRRERTRSMTRQAQSLCDKVSKIGQSRNDWKEEHDGSRCPFIVSNKTYDTYVKQVATFGNWCKETYGINSLEKMEKYVPAYIEHLKEEERSPYTQKLALSACRKVYNNPYEDVKTDSRQREDIHRSRYVTGMSRHFSEEKNSDLVEFCKHTGLRRSEVESLKGGCVSKHDDGHYYIDHVYGKGGKIRDVRILDDNKNVIDRINNTAPDERVWGPVHAACNVHGYRRDYAVEMYRQCERPLNELDRKDIYYCRKDMKGQSFDRQALREVSNYLGHGDSRDNTIVGHYLYGMDK